MPHRKASKEVAQPWTPSEEQMALWPEISGNEINGLGEPEQRRPTPIYWHDPSATPHGPLQRWMGARSASNTELLGLVLENAGLQDQPQAPVEPTAAAARTPEQWSEALRDVARGAGAELVGIVDMDPQWVFEGYAVAHAKVVMIGVAMDYDPLNTAPEPEASAEVMKQYNRGLRVALEVADWLRSQGEEAEGHSGPQAGPINLIPAALAAGFGELGKHGSIINDELGARFRLACVLTSVPARVDAPRQFGADGFCENCRLCTAACPVDAIHDEKQLVRGVEKWYVDFDRCLPFFNEHQGCAACLPICPWSRPGVAPRLAQKLGRRL